MVLSLAPNDEALASLVQTLAAYRQAMTILDKTSGANLVALHEEAYEEIREKTGLPARMVTLALRDHARRTADEDVNDIPLDAKLFAIKGPDTLSIATIHGRALISYAVNGYQPGWADFAEARLRFSSYGLTVTVGVNAGPQPHKKHPMEHPMSSEGILARLGRVIAGVVNNSVDAVEKSNPLAVAEQAVREIGKIAEEARAALAIAIATGHRLQSKADDLADEIRDLDAKIKVGLDNGRHDLARAAAGVQIDLEGQLAALGKAIADNNAEIADAQSALSSIASARADAQKRVEDARRAERVAPSASTPGQRNDERLAAALGAVERVTGVPTSASRASAAVEELGAMQRETAIEERLKAFREGGR